MLTPFVVNEEQFQLLAQNDLGPRIRIIRELLYSNFGDHFTSKNVSLRIGIISPPALSAIERGDTKDCPSKVLRALSRDFSVSMDIFFDDFYLDGYRTILIGGEVHLEHELSEEFSLTTDGSNPFKEKEYTCIVSVDIQASNADRRSMYQRRTRVKLTPDYYTILTADIENSITSLEMIISPELIPSSTVMSPYEKTKLQLDLRHNNPLYIGWVPKAVYDSLTTKMNNFAERYTHRLLAGESLNEDDTKSIFTLQEQVQTESSSEMKKRRKPAQMPKNKQNGE
jgi:hypothetical protein